MANKLDDMATKMACFDLEMVKKLSSDSGRLDPHRMWAISPQNRQSFFSTPVFPWGEAHNEKN